MFSYSFLRGLRDWPIVLNIWYLKSEHLVHELCSGANLGLLLDVRGQGVTLICSRLVGNKDRSVNIMRVFYCYQVFRPLVCLDLHGPFGAKLARLEAKQAQDSSVKSQSIPDACPHL